MMLISLISIIATWTFKNVCRDTFEQSYNDAALLQTSELDGWKVDEEMPFMERERYRKWVVDCHKASYVPVCVNAEDDYLTSEPAVVIPTRKEMDMDSHDQSSASSPKPSGRARTSTVDSMGSLLSLSQKNQSQRGAIFRRVGGATMFSNQNLGHSSFILEEGELSASYVVENKSGESDLDDQSREKLL